MSPAVSRGARQGVQLLAAAKTRLRHGPHDRSDASGQGESLHRRWAAISSRPRPTRNYTSEALARCRLTVQISTKLNRGHLITGEQALILPAWDGPKRIVQKSGQQFVTRRGHDRRRPHVARRACSRRPSICGASRRSSPASPAPRCRIKTTVDWEGLIDELRSHPRAHRARRARASRNTTSACAQPGGFYLPNDPHEGKFNTPSKRAQLHRAPDSRAHRAAGQAVADDASAATTSSTRRSTARTTAIAASRTAAASSFSTPTTSRGWVCEKDQWVDLISHFEIGNAPRGAIQGRPVRNPRRLRRGLLSGDQRAGPDPRHGRRQQSAGVEVDRDLASNRRRPQFDARWAPSP